jgi:hypothetical protein
LDKERATSIVGTAVGRDTTFVINRLYPNPFNNNIQIDFTVRQQDDITFQIHDATGLLYYATTKQQYAPGVYSVTLNPSSLPKGIYNLVVTGQQIMWYKNIMKQ